MINVAINGFGRIGRLVLRIGAKEKSLNFVAINDLTDAKTLAHLLKQDSVHGKFDAKIESGDNSIKINGKKILVLSEKDPTKLPWKKLKVDIVVESTGRFRKEDDLQHQIVGEQRKHLSETIATASIRPHLEDRLGYRFKTDSEGDYFTLQAVLGVKNKS